jgi:hypothetical protein
MNCLVAATTTPRWAANRVWCQVNWLKVCIGAISASAASERDWFVFHMFSAEVTACCSLTVWWKFSTYPAGSAVAAVAGPLWLAATATPAAPPPASTAAAMPRRAFMLARRLRRLLRLFIDASSHGRRARPRARWVRWHRHCRDAPSPGMGSAVT